MNANRLTAMAAGVLFIIATVANVVGVQLSKPFLDAPDYLAELSAHAGRVSIGALLELIAAGACAGIAIALFRVLKPWGTGLAVGSVVFRAAEAVMYMIAVAILPSLLALSERVAAGGSRVGLEGIGGVLLDMREQVAIVAVSSFGVGALMYYLLFYRSLLIPRWLSGWGLIAVVLALGACVVALLNRDAITTYAIVMVPLGVQELVLAVWLIAKGFNSSALESSGRQEVGTQA